ncbi:MAG: isomerizing glutamine--fructose-6-phosphate transaminase [Thermoproteus sp. AZ2]|jgi:glucosamine--fructose-6-phosphate aminotransferase (isomerizing)|uniref:Isomerizing glutamine--fructose-6-phosphate transaminase n=1 Tax=Thermoproteus sp. AZ2 TaxID=1609232 RepID=A0ACC6V2J9_9CREN
MGGIFGFYCKSPRRLLDIKAGLQRLVYRGYDGAGVAYLEGGELKVVKAVGGVDALAVPDISTVAALGHTRYASRGRKTLENTHPLLDCKGEVAVVLDGIIDDYEAIRERLASARHKLRSTTDAEVIPHLLESEPPAEAAKIRGVYAFAALAKDGRMFAVQMGQPLVVALAGDCVFISSDVPSLYGFAEEAYVVPDGSLVELGPGNFNAVDISTGAPAQLARKRVREVQFADKAGYPHFMLKEIYEVPEVLLRSKAALMEKYLRLASMILHGAKSVYVIGNGTSLHAGMVASYYFADVGLGVSVVSAAEFPYYALENVGTGTVVLAISQSGETSDVIKSIRLAKRQGAVIVGVTNSVSSRLAIESNVYLPITAGPEMAVPATKTFAATLETLLILAYYVGLYTGRRRAEDLRGLYERIDALAAKLRSAMPGLEKAAEMAAARLARRESVYVAGSGIIYPVALEAALKLKEAALVHAEGVQMGELLHGPLVMGARGFAAIFLKPLEGGAAELYGRARKMALERGLDVLSVGFGEDLEIAEADRELAPISYAVALQLLAYKTGVARGAPIDTPPGLVKAVVY